MKLIYITWLILLFTSSNTLFANKNQDTLINKQLSKGVKDSIGQLINGKKAGEWRFYYANGNLHEIVFFKDGIENGIYKSFFENTKLKNSGEYLNGLRNGNWQVYRENGKLIEVGLYANGLMNGLWKFLFESGQIQECGYYKDGLRHGIWTKYHKVTFKNSFGEGELLVSQNEYSDETAWKKSMTLYEQNRNISEQHTYHNDKKNGLFKTYHTKGELKEEGIYLEDTLHGLYRRYDVDGHIIDSGLYINGLEHGYWRKGSDVTVIVFGNYIQGLRQGKFKTINGNTKLVDSEEFYLNDTLHGTQITYWSSTKGSVQDVGSWSKGIKIGLWKSYHENGKISQFGNYNKNGRYGIWKYYNESGKLINITNWHGNYGNPIPISR